MTDQKDYYDPQSIEPMVQDYWEQHEAFKAHHPESPEAAGKEKFYCLSMFPYPSGKLHVGHVRNYTLSDVVARLAKMQGKNVLHPMGWDAFGLPAENAAIQNNAHPETWTKLNINNMKKQLRPLGFCFDWSRELATCHPEYYRWEQWLFLKMYEKGLVYKKETTVNWDPVDQTVLANEQVIDGKGWRSGAPVERRAIAQWFLKITDYAEELLNDLDQLEDWPEQVKTMQANWIGRSEGANLTFEISECSSKTLENQLTDTLNTIEVYTTRIDTLYGATFLAVAAEHPLSHLASSENADIAAFIEECKHTKTAEADLATLPKKGIELPFKVKNPLSGELMPVWIANYVLMDYGSGAVMCVPGHDQRDYEFATQYSIFVRSVVASTAQEDQTIPADISEAPFTDYGIVVESGEFNGLTTTAAKTAITKALENKGIAAGRVNYRLRDWGVSRQRYWGAPIPMIRCGHCGDVPVPEEDLPVVLPKDIEITGEGGSPLARHEGFKSVTCPKCGRPAERETDTFDTFMESSWYYARFACPRNDQSILDEQAKYWTPVDQYVGGIEHAILHLLYSRFLHKVIRDLGYLDSDEPFKRLLCQGMVLSETFYTHGENGKTIYHNIQDIELTRDDKGRVTSAKLKSTGEPVISGGIEKMSKSKNNGQDPEELIQRYGADTLRVFAMFASPPDQTLEWNDAGVDGAHRFLKRVYKLVETHKAKGLVQDIQSVIKAASAFNQNQQQMRFDTFTALEKITDDYIRRQNFNTAVAAMMKLVNQLSAFQAQSELDQAIVQEALEILTQMLSPIAPHLSHWLWLGLRNIDPKSDYSLEDAVEVQPWPMIDRSALVQNQMTIVLQVNGKKRGEIQVGSDLESQAIQDLALENPGVIPFIQDKTIKKVIYVPKKLVNIVAV